jgi:hypothetical protein
MMIRSTRRSFNFSMLAAVFYLLLSPLNGVAHADPDVGPAGQVDIIYGDGDEGAIYVGPVTATPHQTNVALQPGDVLYGDADQGAIDARSAPILALSQQGAVARAPSQPDLTLSDGDVGGAPVDLAALAGRSHMSAVELARD